ncbi:MAG TPA: hypothetical protein VGX78_15755 [Pirellulales bacterium]|nr:hypothetical protein [Pirellulales bacterium]
MLGGLMALLFVLVAIAVGVGSLVCFILVLIQMFKRGEQTLGIVCIVLAICTGIGALIAFVYGWVKASEWGLRNVMLAWTACMVANFVLVIIYVAFIAAVVGPQIQQQQQQLQQMQRGN